jgi:hypothetical protein
MFVNLTPNRKEIERRKKIAEENNFKYIPQCDERLMEYGDGIYQCNLDFNFSYNEFIEYNIDERVFSIPFKNSYEVFAPDYNKAQYGVADSVDQLKEYFKEEMEDPNRKFFLTMTPVYQDKENKGKGGGWRWHKWGTYIGKLNPQHEYLDDEDFGNDFQYVICFHLYELK